MNHIYKTIWNKSKNAFDVVSEAVSSKGKTTAGSKEVSTEISQTVKGFFAVLTPLAAMLFVQSVAANTEVASGNTRVFNANNGVQVIDIAKANNAGVSHNRYIKYNVDQRGQVLNNAVQRPDALSIMTKLAGNIQTNKNLDKSARVIINEVTGANRSQLSGHIEIAGGKSDLVIANPYGITCNGCGFINTDRATLTTGTPRIGSDGSLQGFNVRGGDITINGTGLSGKDPYLLQLLSRQLKLDGQINANQLEVVTGSYNYDSETKKVTSVAASGSAPTYAIDSTNLGGIYADRISLISNENGVGVKMLGDVAATAQDFTLTASGKIELNNKVSAKEKISIQNGQTTARQVDVTGSLTAKNVEIGSTTNNKLNLNVTNGTIAATNNLTANVNQLTTKNAGLQADATNTLKAAAGVNLTTTEVLAGQALNIEAASLTTSGVTKLASSNQGIDIKTQGDTNLGNDIQAIAQKNVNINANGNVTLGTGQIKSNTADLNVNATNVTSSATSSAVNTNLSAKEILKLQQNASSSSSDGANLSAKNIEISGKNYAKESIIKSTQNLVIENKGLLSSSSNGQLESKDINVKGQVLGNNLTVKATNQLTTDTSSIVASQNQLTIDSAALILKGNQSAKNVNIDATDISVTQSALLKVTDTAELNAINTTVDGKVNASTIVINTSNDIKSSKSGEINALNDLQLKSKNVSLNGTLNAGTAVLNASQNLTLDQNSQSEVAKTLNLNAGSINLRGEVNALNNNFTANGQLDIAKSAKINAVNQTTLSSSNTLIAGSIVTKNLDLNALNQVDVLTGANLSASNNLELDANTIVVDGRIQSKNLSVTTNSSSIFNKNSQINLANNLTLNAKDFLLNGLLKALNTNVNVLNNVNVSATAQAQIANLANINANNIVIDGELYTKDTTLLASEINLSQTGELIASSKANLTADQIAVDGFLNANYSTIDSVNDLSFGENSLIKVVEDLKANGQDINVNGMVLSNNIDISADSNLVIGKTADVTSVNNTSLNADNINISGYLLGGNTEIKASDNLTLDGQVDSTQLSMSAKDIRLSGVNRANAININALNDLNSSNSALLISNSLLDISAKNASLSGDLYAENIKVQVEQLANLNSDLTTIADNHLEVKSDNLTLGGTVFAKTADLIAEKLLSTLDTSYLEATDTLRLTSNQAAIDLLGKISANNQNISALTNITVGKGTSLNALNSLMLKANTLNQNGKVFNQKGTTTTNVSTLNNNGNFQSNQFVLNGLKEFNNTDTFLSNQSLNLTTEQFSNTLGSNLLSNRDLDLTVTQDGINNLGTIASAQDLNIKTIKSGTNVTNAGTLQATKQINLTTDSFVNNLTVNASENIKVVAGSISNNLKGSLASKNIDLDAKSNITNSGSIFANTVLELTADNEIRNSGKLYTQNLNGKDVLNLTAKTIKNTVGTVENPFGMISSSNLTLSANSLINDGSIQAIDAAFKGESATSKINITNNAKRNNNTAGLYVFESLKADDVGVLTNNGTFNVNLGSNTASTITADNFVNASDASTYLGSKAELFVNNQLDNRGNLYIESGEIDIQRLLNTGNFVLDASTGSIKTDFTNSGNLALTNGANLNTQAFTNTKILNLNNGSKIEATNIVNKGASEANPANIFITNSNLVSKSNITNELNSVITSSGIGIIEAKSGNLVNNELIYGQNDTSGNGALVIDAKKIDNNKDAGILSLAKNGLHLNTKIATSTGSEVTTLNNRGEVYSQDNLVIGNNYKRINVNNLVNSQGGAAVASKATGGMLTSGGNIFISARNVTNNFGIVSNGTNLDADGKVKAGNIIIDVANNFINETTYFGKSLAITKKWTQQPTMNISVGKSGSETGHQTYYDQNGNSVGSDDEWTVMGTRLAKEGALQKGINAAIFTEKWFQSAQASGISNADAKNHLSVTDPARIIANNGNVFITVGGSTARNYGGQIFALGSASNNAGNVSIDMTNTTSKFSNEVIDLYDKREFRVNYILIHNEDVSGVSADYEGAGYAFVIDITKDTKLPTNNLDDDDGVRSVDEYYEERLKNLSQANRDNIRWQTRFRTNGEWTSEAAMINKARSEILSNDKTALERKEKFDLAYIGKAIISGTSNVSIVGDRISNIGADATHDKGKATKNITNSADCETYSAVACAVDNNVGAKDNTSIKNSLNAVGVGAVASKSLDTIGLVGSKSSSYSVITVSKSSTSIAPEQQTVPVNNTTVSESVTNPTPIVLEAYPIQHIPRVDLELPTSKYGQHIPSKNSESKYLVETNPLYGPQSDVLGSSYLTEQLGLDPDKLLKRLGDDGYEMNLVQKQLMGTVGGGVLYANVSASQQMQKLFDNATQESKTIGLVYGQAPTAEQLSRLTTDIVWMVEGTVSGQRVLIPQVYLSPKTIADIQTNGAVIAGKEATILVGNSLTNQNGTLAGGMVYADIKGDIDNIGGRIKGDDVYLISQEGSINNITQSFGFGGVSGETTLGDTAGIESNGTLVLDAAKDINNVGAELKAKGDAMLKAGKNINIKTIEKRSASIEGIENGYQTTNSTTHIGSIVDIGGNAALISTGDTVISGSDVNVKGQMYAKTGGNFVLESVQDTTETYSVTSESGLGVGGGVYGTQTVETTDFEGKNKASNLNVGSLIVDSDNKVVIQGSNISITDKDSVSIISGTKGVDILDGKDEKRSEKITTTTTYLKTTNSGQEEDQDPIYGTQSENIDTNKKGEAADGNKTNTAYLKSTEDEGATQTEAKSKTESSKLSASASASAGASAEGDASLRLVEQTVEIEKSGSTTSVGSNINSAGHLMIKSTDGTVNVQGSKVHADGALAIQAKALNVTAGKNTSYASRDTTVKSIGIYTEGDASASASASASAKAGVTGAQAGVDAQANAQANGSATIGAKLEKESESRESTTHNLSSLSSGGDMLIDIENTAKFEGANVAAGGNLDIKAKDIRNMAVQDTHEESRSSSSKLAGIYIGGSAEAQAGVSAGVSADASNPANPLQANASASAGVSAEGGVGLRVATEDSKETYKSVTNTGNTFTSGGNFTRTAENEIIDQATQVDAGGNIFQKASKITDVAVSDSQTYTKNTSSHDARITFGVSAEAGAGASANAGLGATATAGGGTEAVKKPSLAVGVSASYTGEDTSMSSKNTQAVTSNFKSGGSITTEAKEVSLTGTNFDAGTDINITADKFTFNAAKDTHSSSSSSKNIDVSATVGLDFAGGPDLEVGVGYGQNKTKADSSTAVVGGLNAGGNINITTKTADFEGTQFSSGGNTTVSGNTVNMFAAKDTNSSSTTGFQVGASAGNAQQGSTDKAGKDVVGRTVTGGSTKAKDIRQDGGVSGSFDIGNSSSTKYQGSTVSTGGTFTVNSNNAGVMENVNMNDSKATSISSTMQAVTKKDEKTGFELGGSASLDSKDLRDVRNVRDTYKNSGAATPTVTTETLQMSNKEESLNHTQKSVAITDLFRQAGTKIGSLIPSSSNNGP